MKIQHYDLFCSTRSLTDAEFENAINEVRQTRAEARAAIMRERAYHTATLGLSSRREPTPRESLDRARLAAGLTLDEVRRLSR